MRVVSLCPSITETVFRVGRGDALVGRTKFCVLPEGDVERIERVGGTKNPKVERILELRPDLVLLNEEENRREDADALSSAGITTLSTFACDVPGAIDSVRRIGRALEAADEAEALAAAIEARAGEQRRAPFVSFVYLVWRDPLMAVGPGTYIDALLQWGGGYNTVSGGERYPEVSIAQLRAADRVLLSSEPFPFAARHVEELVAAGVERDTIALVDGQALSWHGARTLEGLAYVAAALGTSSGVR